MQTFSPLTYLVVLAGVYAMAPWVARVFRLNSFARQRGSNEVERAQALDGLRGLLAFSVFVHHCAVSYHANVTGVWAYPSEFGQLGAIAVKLFFCLSGFALWWQALHSTEHSPLRFFIARWKRLAPAYLVSLLAIFFIAFAMTGFELRSSLEETAWACLRWLTFGLPDGAFPPLNAYELTGRINAEVFWTLRLEWLFYLVMPLFTVYLVGFRIFALLATLLGIQFILRNTHTLLPFPLFVLPPFLPILLQTFFVGIVTAFVKLHGQSSRWVMWTKHPIAQILPVICLGLLVSNSRPADVSWIPFYEAVLFFGVLLPLAMGSDVAKLFTNPFAIFMGKVSYSFYLWHGVTLFVVSRCIEKVILFQDLPTFAVWGFALFSGWVTLIISAASFKWIESPWMRKPHLPSKNYRKVVWYGAPKSDPGRA